MGLRISTLSSIVRLSELQKTQKAIARSLERLASGLRVQSPRDDARAYSLGVGLSSQIRGLTQVTTGINSALGMVDTASGALQTQIDIVMRMKELALQASNGLMNSSERNLLNSELQSLVDEYNRITNTTEFNGTRLLDGSFSTIQIQTGTRKGDSIRLGMASTQASQIFQQTTQTPTGTFGAANTFTTGSYPYQVRLGDINNDGKIDAVIPNANDNNISVFLGDGHGSFSRGQTISTGNQPYDSYLVDLNHDDNLDLIYTNHSDGSLSTALGTGHGTFGTSLTYSHGGSPFSLVSGDFNGDGNVDIAANDDVNSCVWIYLGNGDGTLTLSRTDPVGDYSYAFQSADFNNDGYDDLVTYNTGGSLSTSVLFSNGDGTFQAAVSNTTSDDGYAMDIADINNDGFVDMALANYWSSAYEIYLGDGTGTMSFVSLNSTTGSAPHAIKFHDVNGDGEQDLVIGFSGSSGFEILYGDGTGAFTSQGTFGSGFNSDIIFADVNGDGVDDLLSTGDSTNTFKWFLADTESSSSSATLSIDTQSKASDLLEVLDSALAQLQSRQANLTAIHSRLDESASYSLIMSENLQQARSRALDTDFAIEIATLVSNQMLNAAQIASLTHANLNLRLVERLFENLNLGSRKY